MLSEKAQAHNSVRKLQSYHERRKMFIEQLGGRCARCGSTENLEFDHIDKHSKSFSISSHLSYSLSKLQPEIEKCQLLCHECHSLKNIQLRDTTMTIDNESANAIRAEYAFTNISQQKLGEKYGLSQSEIGRIVRNERWKDSSQDFENVINTHNKFCIAVDKIDPNTGIVVKTYNSMKSVEQDGYKSSMVSKCCSGKGKHHGGFIWKKHL